MGGLSQDPVKTPWLILFTCVSLKPKTDILLITALMRHKLVWDSGDRIGLDMPRSWGWVPRVDLTVRVLLNLGSSRSGLLAVCLWGTVIAAG